jgi:DNA-directed RNA polymerase III subunit RPC3
MTAFKTFLKGILRNDFGKPVEIIADVLMTSGSQTQAQILHLSSGLDSTQVKMGLIVLITHSIVKVISEEVKRKPKANEVDSKKRARSAKTNIRFVYEIDVEAVRHRISSTWFIILAKQRFGPEAEFLTEAFVQHGKLLIPQLVDLCIPKLIPEVGEDPTVLSDTKVRVEGAFKDMYEAGYVKRADQLGTAIKSSKKAKTDRAAEQKEDEEGEKQEDGPDDSRYDVDSTFFCLNPNQFQHELRHQEIVEYVRCRLNPTASALVHIFLLANPSSSSDVSPQPVSLAKISELASTADTPLNVTDADLKRCLDQLCSNHCKVFCKHSEGYVLNHRHVFQQLRQSHSQSIVSGKCEVLAGRVFKLLLKHKRLEEKQVVEMATAPKQKVRAALYAMLKAGFVSLQEVAKSAERQPSRAYFLWGVPMAKVNEDLLDSFYFTWGNLRQRVAAANERIKPILDKLDLQEGLTEPELEKRERWRKADDKLQLQLLQMDKLIMLFRDF